MFGTGWHRTQGAAADARRSLQMTRDELMAPYAHPYRHALAEAWRSERELRRATLWIVGSGLVGAAGYSAGITLMGLLAGLLAVLWPVLLVLWVVVTGREGYRLIRSWGRRTELGDVRARRPQAGTEDPVVAHDEFAVSVEDDGCLVTWRFRPLLVSEDPTDDETEVPGRPRYAALPIDEQPLDPDDVVHASEQLVAAQSQAARREAARAAAAQLTFDDDDERARLATETQTTVAALQRVTGQRRDG